MADELTARSLLDQLNRSRPAAARAPASQSSPSPPPPPEPAAPPAPRDEDLPCWTKALAKLELEPAEVLQAYAMRYYALRTAAADDEACARRISPLPADLADELGGADPLEWAAGVLGEAVADAVAGLAGGDEPAGFAVIPAFMQGALRVVFEVYADAPDGAVSAWTGAALTGRALRLQAIRADGEGERTDELFLEGSLPRVTHTDVAVAVQTIVDVAQWETLVKAYLSEVSFREATPEQFVTVLMTHRGREALTKFCVRWAYALRLVRALA